MTSESKDKTINYILAIAALITSIATVAAVPPLYISIFGSSGCEKFFEGGVYEFEYHTVVDQGNNGGTFGEHHDVTLSGSMVGDGEINMTWNNTGYGGTLTLKGNMFKGNLNYTILHDMDVLGLCESPRKASGYMIAKAGQAYEFTLRKR